MITVLQEATPIARKEYDCIACEWLNVDNFWAHNGELRFVDFRNIVKARRNNWKIQKGQRYINQRLKGDNGFYTFRAIPEIHDICSKLDIYQD